MFDRNEYNKKDRLKDPLRYKRYKKRYKESHPEQAINSQKRWYQKHKEDRKIYKDNWYKNNKEKSKAHSHLNYKIRKGEIKRLPCEVCGNEKVEGHHEDYNKPLDVIWLCRKHHWEIHHKEIK